LGPLLGHQSQLLQPRCDARGFGPVLIELIAERKIALTFERIGPCNPHSANAIFCLAQNPEVDLQSTNGVGTISGLSRC
jgi:hypothetical protein